MLAERLNSSVIAQIAALWDRNDYAVSIAPDILRRHIAWKYAAGRAVIFTECYKGRILATTGYFNGLLWAGKKIVKAGWGVDSLVDRALRGKRVFLFLKVLRATLKSPEHELVLAFPGKATVKTFLKTGWKLLDGFWRLRLRLAGRRDARPLLRGVTLTWDNTVDWQEVEALFDRVKGRFSIIPWRDAGYCRWRYEKCPSRTYKVLRAYRDGVLIGFLVVRFNSKLEDQTCYIIDILCDPQHKALISGLIAELVAKCPGHKVAEVVTVLTDKRFLEVFQKEGFVRQKKEVVLLWLKNERVRKIFTQDLFRVHVTMSDGDYDME